jgi:HD-GYP domain-containing protein (c-di-GMP phosphodiesterase class II)
MPLSEGTLALADAASHPLAHHSRAVAELAGTVAVELGLSASELYEVELAALFHDVGKLGLMDELLDKPEGLTAEEISLVREHPVRGQAMLEQAGRHFTGAARIVRSCHERWDGGGYPDGLSGEQIPLAARIVFCCDAYDAMTSERPYSTPRTRTLAVAELWACAGSQFDPKVVAALVRTVSRAPGDPARADGHRAPQPAVAMNGSGSARAPSG